MWDIGKRELNHTLGSIETSKLIISSTGFLVAPAPIHSFNTQKYLDQASRPQIYLMMKWIRHVGHRGF